MKKKLYTCRHQKDAAISCATCKEGRGNEIYSTEYAASCDKCGEIIVRWSKESVAEEGNEKYREE